MDYRTGNRFGRWVLKAIIFWSTNFFNLKVIDKINNYCIIGPIMKSISFIRKFQPLMVRVESIQ
uniref:Uncharacterized protein n=1 Tax=Virgibacillus oceani TaxID=1479511 RepID=A0A917HIH4_9BACI|nr:hypothetical protein GCM10011398_26920 [Virgibacillus oceani]